MDAVFSRLRSVFAYLALFFGTLSFLPGSSYFVTLLACMLIFLGWGQLRPVARIIASLLLLVSVLSLTSIPIVLSGAIQSMARITGLILSVMLLSAVLGASRDLGVISQSLFKGNSVTRYLGLSLGTGVLAIPLNFGSVGLVAPMIGNQVHAAGDNAATRNASRAVIRGFGASPMGSPLSIAVVLTVTLLQGLSSWSLLVWSIPFAVAYLMVGAWFREGEESVSDSLGAMSDTVGDGRSAFWPWMRFIGLALFISVEAYALNTWAGLQYSQAVTLGCLTVAMLHLLGSWRITGSIGLPSMANVANELAIMGGASFLGGVLSVTALSSLGSDFLLPGWAYPVAAFGIPWLFYAGGAVGVNPILTATVTGGVLGPIWPTPALTGLGIAMVTGWGITIAGTPYSANAILLERFTGYGARMAAYGWNLSYSFIFLSLSGCLCAAIVLASL